MKKKSISVLVLLGIVMSALLLGAASYFGIGRGNFLGVQNIHQGLDLKGGVSIVYEADAENPTAEEMQSAVSLIQGRLDRRGWTEAELSRQGDKRIRLDIPGVDNAEQAISEVGATAKLTFRDENNNVLLEGADVANAYRSTNGAQQATWVVSLEFTNEGTTKFEQATRDNVGKSLGIYLDEDLISNPTVNSAIIGSSAVIEGDFTPESSNELAALIRAGSLPFNLNVVNMSNVGAKLGANSLETSVFAGFVGIALVFIFMLFVYRLAGVMADIALTLYIAVVLVVLSLFEVTLTLPGIAGVILSTGMAVDANVIIFERLKEEIQAKRSLRTAVKNAFSRAFSAIFDSNITTMISCAVLFWLGVGPVKGFAQTLFIGIVVSMFTSLVITRLLLNVLVGLGVERAELFRINMNKPARSKPLSIVANRFKWFAISGAALVVAVVFSIVNGASGKGAFNLDVEFAGGLAMQIDIGESFNNNDIEDIIETVTGQTAPQIQKVTGGNSVAIKIRSITQEKRIELTDKLKEKYPNMEVSSVDDVSATVSGEMQRTAILAIIVSSIAMLIYITIRFRDIKFGGASILAILHDALITIAVYAVFRIPLNYSFIAAILTVTGYSINANIVIFDRMRENKKIGLVQTDEEFVNLGITQSVTRAVYSSLTTLVTIASVAIFGVSSVREFSIPIIAGIVFGTYSSICLAGSFWYMFNKSKKRKTA
ncbi:MAG: protein translocase subunit SecD [Clostridiales bacterium]|jgi:SecD/SecF fusion protein|nr:protein translocase subunit SecD [Clostridiales bacterium]